jgi:NAD(P)H-dependent FMN reductase
MYTIISATNRTGSHTEKVSRQYLKFLQEKGIDATILSLEGLNVMEKNETFSKIEQELLVPAAKFIFVMPEYNGSYPGVLKAMIDISDVKKSWWGKKALLTGISTGRAGILRGMEHFTGVLNHVKIFVHPNKLPISIIDTVMDPQGSIFNPGTLRAIDQQLEEFINF